MTSLEKAINLGYPFLTFKSEKRKKTINTCTNFFCVYWYVSIYSEKYFWPQYMYPKLSTNNGYRWCPLGKLSHLGLEQLITIMMMMIVMGQFTCVMSGFFWSPFYFFLSPSVFTDEKVVSLWDDYGGNMINFLVNGNKCTLKNPT